MSPHDAFLQAILERPDDDAPRLMYADWLTEHGDPRGDFIRAQCVAACLDDDDPERWLLEERARELVFQFGEKWSEPVRKLVRVVEFRRGFIESVTTTPANFLANAGALFRLAPICHATLERRSEGEREFTALAGSPFLAKLTGLHLTSMYGHFLDPEQWRPLCSSPHLGNLKSLKIDRCRLGPGSLQPLAESRSFPALESLDLSRNYLLDGNWESLTSWPQFGRLKNLSVFSTYLDDERLRRIVNAPRSVPLVSLALGGNSLTYAGLHPLLTSPHIAGIQSLGLNYCGRFGREGMQVLAASPHLRQLRNLEIAGNLLRTAGVQDLVDATNLRKLRRLDLGANRIGDLGVKVLASSRLLGRLTYLSLADNLIETDGAKCLARSRKLSRLQRLDLSSNRIGGAGADALLTSKHLPDGARVSLACNGISPKYFQTLRKRHSQRFHLEGSP